jgi:uncharacterized protein (DUF1330 family)
MVGITVTDEAGYQRYRDAMAPLLQAHGGGFRCDFTIERVLKSDGRHPINRVFVISLGSMQQKEAFFAHPEYLAIKAQHFETAVAAVTVFGAWDR